MFYYKRKGLDNGADAFSFSVEKSCLAEGSIDLEISGITGKLDICAQFHKGLLQTALRRPTQSLPKFASIVHRRIQYPPFEDSPSGALVKNEWNFKMRLIRDCVIRAENFYNAVWDC